MIGSKFVEKNKPLIESFFSLSILNGLSVLMPLITLPYILRVVGAANYGIYSYVYVLIQYLLLINSYGFNYSATKQIAQNRDNIVEINRIYNSVTIARLLLLIAGVVFFLILSPILLNSSTQKLMFLMGIGIVLGDTFNPIWLYQGMEKMRYMTIVNLISKVFFTFMIFVLIDSADDFKYIILYNSLGFLVAGILSTLIAVKQFGISLMIPRWTEIVFQFKEGAALFGSTIGINLYNNANIFILKFFVDDSMLGIYSAAEKIINGLRMIISPFAYALFPHLGKEFHQQSLIQNLKQLKRVSFPYLGILIVTAFFGFFFSDFLVGLICGKEFYDAVPIVMILSIVVIVGGMNNLLGFVGLVNLNYQQYFFRYVLISGLISIIFLLISVKFYGIYSAAWAMAISETVLLTLILLRFSKLLRLAKKKD